MLHLYIDFSQIYGDVSVVSAIATAFCLFPGFETHPKAPNFRVGDSIVSGVVTNVSDIYINIYL